LIREIILNQTSNVELSFSEEIFRNKCYWNRFIWKKYWL